MQRHIRLSSLSSFFHSDRFRRCLRTQLALLLIASFVIIRPQAAHAQTTGKTWTCILLCGGTLLYYIAKLDQDNRNTDAQGNVADAFVDNPWQRADATSTLRNVRAAIIDNIYLLDEIQHSKGLAGYHPTVPTRDQWKKIRAQYENLRTCWNSFVYSTTNTDNGGGSAASSAASGTDKGGGKSLSDASAAPTTGDTASSASGTICGADPDKIAAASGANLDSTDIQTAFSKGSTLYQQVIDLSVGRSIDYNAVRGEYLYYLASGFDNQIQALIGANRGGGGGGGDSGIVTTVTNCVVNLSPTDCISSLGTIESTYAADRRHDVACDIAMRAQLPMLSTIRRVLGSLKQTNGANPPVALVPPAGPLTINGNVETPLEGPGFNFGAVPGC